MMTKNEAEDPSPLFLASFERFELIKWGKLTEKDITECDDKGNTLLHHCAKEGLWRKLPEKLRDQKYWKPTFDNTTIFMCAVQSDNTKWINEYNITKGDILEENKIGDSTLSLAILNNNLNAIPKNLITKDILKEKISETERYIHFIARAKKIKLIDWELLDEEILSIKNAKGNSSYHILAENQTLRLTPKHTLTLKAILQENNEGMSPLDLLVHNENPKEILSDEFFTEEIFFKEKENIEAPIHPWAEGQAWAKIPKKFITPKTLGSKGKESLLKTIISRYAQTAVWFHKEDVPIKEMTDLVKLCIKYGDKKEIQEILKNIESLEKGDTYPTGVKKASLVIKEELTKRKVFEEISNNQKSLEI